MIIGCNGVRSKPCSLLNGASSGFSLLEVLVALLILGLAITAIGKTMIEQIHKHSYLQQKIAANWVALNTLSYIQLGLLQVPSSPSILDGEVRMLNQDLIWSANKQSTAAPLIEQIEITVKLANKQQPLMTHRSFLAVANG